MGSPVCHWVRSVLVAYLDGELKPSTAQAVRRHLEHCKSCASEAELLADTGRMIAQQEVPPIRAGFTERMMVRIVEEKELEALEASLRPHRRRQKVLASLAGMAAGLVLGLTAYGWTSLTHEPNSPVEREVSRNVSFLKDVDLLDAMAVIDAMDHMTGRASAGPLDGPDESGSADASGRLAGSSSSDDGA